MSDVYISFAISHSISVDVIYFISPMDVASGIQVNGRHSSGETATGDEIITITLVEAIKEKYCNGPDQYYSDEVLPVFRVIKEYAPNSKPGNE